MATAIYKKWNVCELGQPFNYAWPLNYIKQHSNNV
jgi:hypothetical protein